MISMAFVSRWVEFEVDGGGFVATNYFRLAVHDLSSSARGEWQKETDWFTIVAWCQLAEMCHYHLAKKYEESAKDLFQRRVSTKTSV